MEFEEIERPERFRRYRAFRLAIQGTLASGQAVRVPINGRKVSSVRNSCNSTARNAARDKNAKFHCIRVDDSFAIWLEPT